MLETLTVSATSKKSNFFIIQNLGLFRTAKVRLMEDDGEHLT